MELHGGGYKRATFYFPKGDEVAIEQYLQMPDHRHPGEIRDLQFKFCGHKLKKSTEFDAFVAEKVPQKFQSRFSKSEKGIDIEICCDALRLASRSRLERLFLFTNDGDFIPLCRTIKEYGANVSIIHLFKITKPNHDLLREADSYDVVTPLALNTIFFPISNEDKAFPSNDEVASPAVGAPESEKPMAEPSDLKIIEDPKTPTVKDLC